MPESSKAMSLLVDDFFYFFLVFDAGEGDFFEGGFLLVFLHFGNVEVHLNFVHDSSRNVGSLLLERRQTRLKSRNDDAFQVVTMGSFEFKVAT